MNAMLGRQPRRRQLPRSASSATFALNSAEYRVRFPVIESVLLRANRTYPPVRIPGTTSGEDGAAAIAQTRHFCSASTSAAERVLRSGPGYIEFIV